MILGFICFTHLITFISHWPWEPSLSFYTLQEGKSCEWFWWGGRAQNASSLLLHPTCKSPNPVHCCVTHVSMATTSTVSIYSKKQSDLSVVTEQLVGLSEVILKVIYNGCLPNVNSARRIKLSNILMLLLTNCVNNSFLLEFILLSTITEVYLWAFLSRVSHWTSDPWITLFE